MWHFWHRWEPVAIRWMATVGSGGHVSAVLYRCACGRTKTEILTGHWSIEQVKGVE